ncbi:MAG: right-handed parallel beta-helix repeat-containing protein, partial [Actinobacteria bacterium]|nr:right-handed parallel beta-helix repeat-containing protein [Actinomycetota bacterium]
LNKGPDGNVWYTDNANKVGKVTPNGTFTEFPIPTSGSQALGIAPGVDGNVWFTESVGNRIARVTPSGHIQEFLLPHANSDPQDITAGPGHKMWFTEMNEGFPGPPPSVGRVGYIDPASITPAPGPCMVVSHSTTLTHDVGPCRGDGIVVRGDNLTLDLGGHKVFAAPGHRVGEFAGIHLDGANGVEVKHGEVTRFDAGVWLDGGSNNTVTGLYVHHNLSPPDEASRLGDGIVLFHSSANRITHNVVAYNGVFDGIGVLGLGSNDNTITDNSIHHNTDRHLNMFDPGGGTGIIINSFLESEVLGRGESLSGNNVVHNTVRDNASSGISSISNDGAHIEDNTVAHNGFYADGSPGNPRGNGIGIDANAAADPTTANVVRNNLVQNNFAAGIEVLKDGNSVADNRFLGNGQQGIFNDFGQNNTYTNNVATSNQLDLYDSFSDCDGNVWSGNTYG